MRAAETASAVSHEQRIISFFPIDEGPRVQCGAPPMSLIGVKENGSE